MKKIILILILLPFLLFSQKKEKKLQLEIENLVKGFNGQVGISIKSLKTNKIVQFNADTIFPTASMVKVPILIGLMDKMRKGKLSYHQNIQYKDSLLYEGEDILGSFKNNENIALAKAIMLMLTTSDNTASLWLQNLAGSGTEINKILDSLGYKYTRVNSRTKGREVNRKLYGWGQTTPNEMVNIFEKMYKGQIFSDSLSQKMIRLLGRNYWDEEAIGEIPATIFVASKNGAVNESRSETLLVMAKEPYIFSIITKNQKDVSWEANNEGWVLARKLSKLLYCFYGK